MKNTCRQSLNVVGFYSQYLIRFNFIDIDLNIFKEILIKFHFSTQTLLITGAD